jgi:hypothetical protein
MLVILIMLLGIMVTMLVLVALNSILPVWFCHVFGWHLSPKSVGFDGCSLNGDCPRCGKYVLQDSQGNWF